MTDKKLDENKLVYVVTSTSPSNFNGSELGVKFTNGRAIVTAQRLKDAEAEYGLVETLQKLEARGYQVEQVRDEAMPADVAQMIQSVLPDKEEEVRENQPAEVPQYIPAIEEAEEEEEKTTRARRTNAPKARK